VRRGCQAATRGQTCPAQGEKNGRHGLSRAAERSGVRAMRPIPCQTRTMSTSRVTTMTTRRALARLMRRTLPASSRASLACRTLA
jgi:hypothetical protein